MKVVFADSFFKSLKKLNRNETWYMKTIHFFQYDIPNCLKNIHRFRKVLWEYRPWDSAYALQAFKIGLKSLAKVLKDGNEVDETRLPKYEKINKVIDLLDHCIDDSFIELAEDKLGKEVNSKYLFGNEPEDITISNKEVFDLAREIEVTEWEELWYIIKGDDNIKGTNLKAWWD